MVSCSPVPIITSFLMVTQIAVAALIIGLTATRLNTIKMDFDMDKLEPLITDTCLLGTGDKGVNLCHVAYAFSAISILAAAALSLLFCCTCNLCGLRRLADTLFALAGTAWWATGAGMLNTYAKQPRNIRLPQPEARGWIVVLCWVDCALFGAAFLVNFVAMLCACCRCCRGGGGGRRDVECVPPPGGKAGQYVPQVQYIQPVQYVHHVQYVPAHQFGAGVGAQYAQALAPPLQGGPPPLLPPPPQGEEAEFAQRDAYWPPKPRF
ncbi:MAG: hypothetical protein J3K34DRAFT_519683 [Monoraphidium minutum]|nr:MAG: hypothetical protein J3K34DRAFT_519683 [Monoraphidium minutum]